ncbi:hypothetical protein BJX66DRAFT_237567 [Aspergillus keveii]|uniref:Uncharacterized protein n=1 Tax=Aspergillus keveii TaxID=714993 RepID=A0ABR4G141_9EURO
MLDLSTFRHIPTSVHSSTPSVFSISFFCLGFLLSSSALWLSSRASYNSPTTSPLPPSGRRRQPPVLFSKTAYSSIHPDERRVCRGICHRVDSGNVYLTQ